MSFSRNRGGLSSRVLQVPVDQVTPNPAQPRAVFDREGLDELARSISLHGILQPLSVRKLEDGGYQLIAGERRLRAARLAGLSKVPCITVDAGAEEASLLALVENLQRRDLDFLEEALALSQLIATYRLTQEEVARRIGKSQSAVANKLRLLRLDPDALTLLRGKGFSERHARALLRLPDDARQRQAADYIARHDLTVRAAEAYVDKLLKGDPQPGRTRFVLRDVRIFLNAIDKNLRVVRAAGLEATCRREESDEAITLTITVPKAAS